MLARESSSRRHLVLRPSSSSFVLEPAPGVRPSPDAAVSSLPQRPILQNRYRTANRSLANWSPHLVPRRRPRPHPLEPPASNPNGIASFSPGLVRVPLSRAPTLGSLPKKIPPREKRAGRVLKGLRTRPSTPNFSL